MSEVAFSSTVLVIAAFEALGLALLTLSRGREKRLNQACAGVLLCLTLSHVGTLFSYRIGMSGWLLAEVWLPAALLYFVTAIARATRQSTTLLRRARRTGVALAALATAGMLVPGRWHLPTHTLGMPLNSLGQIAVALQLGLLLIVLLQLENIYRSAHEAVRWQLKYLLVGIGFVAAMRVYLATLAILYAMIDVNVGPQLAVATIIGGSMLGFAVVRHRLLSVDVFISRYVIYNSITLLAVSSYLLILGLLVYGARMLGGQPSVVTISAGVFVALAVLVIALLSDTLRWKVRHFVDRNFYKNRHDYQVVWQKVTRSIAREHSLEALMRALDRIIRSTLGANYVKVLIEEGQGRGYRSLSTGETEPLARQPLGELESDSHPAWGTDHRRVVVFRKVGDTALIHYLPLRVGDEQIGWLGIGPRKSGSPYHMEDLALATAIGAQAGVAIRNLQLGTDLAETREQAALHQLSTFFIHDMKNTTNSLGLLAQNIHKNRTNPEFWDDAESSLRAAVSQMNELSARLRSLREHQPAPARPIDLADLLTEWSRRWQENGDSTVEVRVAGPLPCAADATDLDSVFTNLVNNAAEAGARLIQLSGELRGREVYVEVEDDGCGMAPDFIEQKLFKPFASTKQQGMGIGLFQARRIVQQLGGHLTVISSPNVGTKFTVRLPVSGSSATVGQEVV